MLIVVYDSDNVRVYVVRTDDDTECIINTRNECVAQVTELADGFDVDDLPRNVPATVPGGRAQPAPDNPEPPPASPPSTPAPAPVPPVAVTPDADPPGPEPPPPPSTLALSDEPTSFKVGVGPDVSAGDLTIDITRSFTHAHGEFVLYNCAEPSASWINFLRNHETITYVTARPRPAHVGDSETITCTATRRGNNINEVIKTLSVTYTFTVVRRTLIERKIETATFKLAPIQPRNCTAPDGEHDRDCYLYERSSEFPAFKSTGRIHRTKTPEYRITQRANDLDCSSVPCTRSALSWLTILTNYISGNAPATLTVDIPYCPPFDENLQGCHPGRQ